ncbi:PocR ligand-binding domain-containing protein [Acetonema longum]|uniref:histidine kinase n=1 Tax=Acetonema longum DSM 6540 TaxID=1009370 RepID=F7NH30_9FIRM|nr:PocR ligand-binding domain-containing protein [Acetonema longum]EGO64761.1 histidine kinase [Acetonema longum DSM 6540]
MHNLQGFALSDIVNMQVLQEIQDRFADATGLAAVIVDVNGSPVTTPSNFTRLCNYIRSYPEGLARCMDCDDRGGRKAAKQQRPYVYHCHSGALTDLAAPIIVQNEYVGAVLAGQVILPQEGYEPRAEMLRRLVPLGLEPAILSEYLDLAEVLPENRLKASADLIHLLANYVVEMGIANIRQQQLVTEIKAKADLENLLRAAELKALQSQVNPHFLFNTLNTIARLALLEEAPRTQEVVYALADMLRNNLRDMDQLRTVEEEVKSVRDYFTIQSVRFGDRIKTDIDITPSLMETLIPALTLQPLVENSILHGLEPKRDGGMVQITGRLDGDRVVLAVVDTGVGVPPERIYSIFRAEKRPVTKGQTTGLGIINVHKRIQHFFGSKYGLNMESKVGEGTRIYIQLPYPS